MGLEIVKAVVSNFLSSPQPGVLAIKGAWGIGKTYAWNSIIVECREKISLNRYCYVSLFGIASLQELQVAIFAKTRARELIGKQVDAKSINEHWHLFGNTLFKKGVELYQRATQGTSQGRMLSVGIEQVAPHFIDETLVCLDDFERLSDALKVEEVLGFISSLKEEKKCKVVLIFNHEKLGAKADAYKKYREKLIDVELLYNVTAADAAELVFDNRSEWHEQAIANAGTLRISNIRLLRKIDQLAATFWEQVKDLHESVRHQAIHSLVLFVWGYFESSPEKPSIDFIQGYHNFASAFNRATRKKEGKQTPEDAKEEEWEQVLGEYKFNNFDDFDRAILMVVEQGYVEGTGIREQGEKNDKAYREQELDQSFTKAWDYFHNSFDGNADELIKVLADSFKRSVQQVSAMNASSTITLIRELGNETIADELLEFYIASRAHQPEIFDLAKNPFGREITDKKFRDRFEQEKQKATPVVSLEHAAALLAKDEGWTTEALKALDTATADDFYKLFKSIRGEALHKTVRACLRVGGIADHGSVRTQVTAALKRIELESPLNAARVRRYGLA